MQPYLQKEGNNFKITHDSILKFGDLKIKNYNKKDQLTLECDIDSTQTFPLAIKLGDSPTVCKWTG